MEDVGGTANISSNATGVVRFTTNEKNSMLSSSLRRLTPCLRNISGTLLKDYGRIEFDREFEDTNPNGPAYYQLPELPPPPEEPPPPENPPPELPPELHELPELEPPPPTVKPPIFA